MSNEAGSKVAHCPVCNDKTWHVYDPGLQVWHARDDGYKCLSCADRIKERSAIAQSTPAPDVEALCAEADVDVVHSGGQTVISTTIYNKIVATLRAALAEKDAQLAAVTKKWKACQEWISDYEKTASAEQDELDTLREQLAAAREELEKVQVFECVAACATGDCPHENINECVQAQAKWIGKYSLESQELAEKLEVAHTYLSTVSEWLKSGVYIGHHGVYHGPTSDIAKAIRRVLPAKEASDATH